MMAGWIVVNAFYSSPKFDELHEWLKRSAGEARLTTTMVTNAQVQGLLRRGERPEWVLFWDKDVHVARLIEAFGIRCLNSARAIEMCDDKSRTYLELLAQDIPQPETWVVPLRFASTAWDDSCFVDDAIDAMGLPLVAKEAFGSFGAQVHLVHSRDELVGFLDNLGTAPALLQRFVASSTGRDLRLQVVGDQVVAAIERNAQAGEFRANLTHGGTAHANAPTVAQRDLALATTAALGLDFAGVDLLFGEDGVPVVCEVNSNAHFVNISQITGIDVGRAIMEHIRDA
ncbi:RimK family alpha-L-glutamate ligase [Corynebacterium breve]|uniref:RimK family alpha-L-glutamate ligase n=1 Tax=Corynebacterium breve TaxID=3049799 RepID=A0ABY8VHZ7_9CORY|nr:RimK family alpha-L-glutamate ligase [Corynebacterium breve]WIM67175.1 RimK family alpha-L-glutamate ligase [Corynebacterium breve]